MPPETSKKSPDRGRSRGADPARLLADGIRALDIQLPAGAPDRLLRYLAELSKWNAAFNLTAVRAPEAMVVRHLLDSLATLPVADALLDGRKAPAVLDIGSGAGLPAIPLAIARPQWRVVALDSNGKKTRFMRHAQRTLGLEGFAVVEGRCEDYRPEAAFDVLVSRAFAALGEFLRLSAHLGAPGAYWLAMKGRLDNEEMKGLPEDFELQRIVELQVPQLDEQRHVLVAARRAMSGGAA